MASTRKAVAKRAKATGDHAAPKPKTRGSGRSAREDAEPSPAGRPIWSGSISFGLLQIPVTLHSAESRQELHFTQLDKSNLSPIGYQRINKATGKTVEWSDIVKGYEYEKGKYVVMTDADFKAANVEATETIDIQDFVDADEIDPTYYETPYYLAPGKRAQKAYAVLREALRRQKKAAVATFVMRSREHLCAVFAQEDVLLLEVLRFPYELRDTESLALPAAGSAQLKLHPKELEMAERLIAGMASEWDPSKYHDRYRDDLLATIHEKARTGKVTPAHTPKREHTGNVVDLMSLLRRSVEKAEGGKKADRASEDPGPRVKKATSRRAGAKRRAA